MTAYVPSASSIIAGVVHTSVAANDSVTFLQPFTFFSTSLNAVNILHANNAVYNMTTVMSANGIAILVNSVADCEVTNTASGTIACLATAEGVAGVSMLGDRNTLRNAGEIYSSNGTGVYFGGTGSIVENSGRIEGGHYGLIATFGDYALMNSGTIQSGGIAGSIAVYMDGIGTGKTLVNSGLIQAMATEGGIGVQVAGHNLTTIINSGTILSVSGQALDASMATGRIHLTNSGTMTGSAAFTMAVSATVLSDTIINTGTINRSVWLDDGDDVFDGIGGFVGGTVFGGDGSDVFRLSDPLALVFEDTGQGLFDRVESTVSYSLAAAGEVEQLTLLGTATDGSGNDLANLINGNNMDNLLRGGGGSDTMFGRTGDDVVRGGLSTDTLYGGSEDDALYGDAQADRLYGDAGDDVLTGGSGRDLLYGGEDADSFRFRLVSDSKAGASLRDAVMDFEAGLDLIDLTRIDANANATGNQGFAWIGAATFGNVAGELRLVAGVNSLLQGDVNGDGVADFEVQFNGIATISVNDILL